MKKSVLLILPLLLIKLASAQFFGGYGRFSITDFFYSIDPPTMTLGLLFFIFFPLLFFILGRFFKDSYGEPNKGIAGTISFAISVLIIYGIWSSGWDLTGFFYYMGLSTDVLYFILPIILFLLALIIIWKLGFKRFLVIFGLLIIVLTFFTDLFYEKGVAFVIGAAMLIIGGWLKISGGRYDWQREKRQAGAIGRGAWGATKGIGKGAALAGKGAWKAGKWARNRYKFENYGGVFRDQRKKAERMQGRHENLEEIRAAKQRMHEIKGRPPTKWAQKKYMAQMEEEARQRNIEIKRIDAQIKSIDNNRRRYKSALKKSVSPQQAAMIQKAINDIENQKRILESERARLTIG